MAERLIVRSRSGLPESDTWPLGAYLGISFSKTDYFTKDRVRDYIDWSVTRFDRLMILVADHLEAYNFQGLKGQPAEEAFARARSKGDELITAYGRIVPAEYESRVRVVTASVLLETAECARTLDAVRAARSGNAAFAADLRSAVTTSLLGGNGGPADDVHERRKRVLANAATLENYMLEEIALILYLALLARPRYEVALFPYDPQPVIPRVFDASYRPAFDDITRGDPFRFINLSAESIDLAREGLA